MQTVANNANSGLQGLGRLQHLRHRAAQRWAWDLPRKPKPASAAALGRETERLDIAADPADWPKRVTPNVLVATEMVFPTGLKSRNSGSELHMLSPQTKRTKQHKKRTAAEAQACLHFTPGSTKCPDESTACLQKTTLSLTCPAKGLPLWEAIPLGISPRNWLFSPPSNILRAKNDQFQRQMTP